MKMEAAAATEPSRSSASASATTTVLREDNTSFLALHVAALRHLADLSTHPLVSAFSAAYVLGVLYLPRRILSLLLSPALVSALLLLATLFYFGSSSRHDHPQTRSPPPRQEPLRSEDRQQPRQEQEQHQRQLPSFPRSPTTPDTEFDSPVSVLCSTQKPLLLPERHDHFVEWPRWGPLEVIYEEEVDEDVVRSPGYSGSPWLGRGRGTEEMKRVAPLSYSDDSDDDTASSSGDGSSPAWELPEDLFLRWEAEEEGLIEIPLEEDNLIEIDISACR